MNMILLEQADFISDQRVELRGRRHRHITSVLKANEGDEFQIGVWGGQLGKGRIVDIGSDHSVLDIVLSDSPPHKQPIILVLALPRPPVFRRLISAVTSLGVERICVIQSARVEKSYWNSPLLTEGQVHEAMVLGLEQARDTAAPDISFHRRFESFVEDVLPELARGRTALMAHPGHAQPCPGGLSSPVIAAIGPEGGFVDFECARFQNLGFQPVHLGQRILRVETAVPALIGRVMGLG